MCIKAYTLQTRSVISKCICPIQFSLLVVVLLVSILFVPKQVAHADAGSITPEENPVEVVTGTAIQAEAVAIDEAPQKDTLSPEGDSAAEESVKSYSEETSVVSASEPAVQSEESSPETTFVEQESKDIFDDESSADDAVNDGVGMLANNEEEQSGENEAAVEDDLLIEERETAFQPESGEIIEDLEAGGLIGAAEEFIATEGNHEAPHQTKSVTPSENSNCEGTPEVDGTSEGANSPDAPCETETVQEALVLVIDAPAFVDEEFSIQTVLDVPEEEESSIQTVLEVQEEEGNEPTLALDPYFERQGEMHYFRNNCNGYLNCSVSGEPISAALRDVEINGLPDDGVINIEGGHFSELLMITNLVGELTLRGGADDQVTYLDGSVIVHDTNAQLKFQNVVFNAGLSIIQAARVSLAEVVLNGGLSVMNSEVLQIEGSVLDGGVVVMNTGEVNIAGSQFSAGVVFCNVEQVAVSGSQMGAGVIVDQSDNVVFEDTIFAAGISIRDSQVGLNGSDSDDHFDVVLEEGPSRVQVDGGDGIDSLSVTQTLAVVGEVVVNEGLASTPDGGGISLNDTIENLTLAIDGPAGTQVLVSGMLSQSGSLEISADEIRIVGDVTAEKILLNAGGSVIVENGASLTGVDNVMMAAGDAVRIAGLVESQQADIVLQAQDGVALLAGAHIVAAGRFLVNADSDGDGVGSYLQESGVLVEALGSIVINADDVFIFDLIETPTTVQLLPSWVNAPVEIGVSEDHLNSFSVSQSEINLLQAGEKLFIGVAGNTGPVSIGKVDLSILGIDLEIHGGHMDVGQITMTSGRVLSLLALGIIADANGALRNITIAGGTLFVQAGGFGAANDPLETHINMFLAQVDRVGSAFLSDLKDSDPPISGGIYLHNDGDLTIGDQDLILASDGEIIVSAVGTLIVAGPVTAGGLVRLAAYWVEQGAMITGASVELIEVPDPHLISGGEVYNYLTIQAAIDAVAGGLTPDDGIIYVESGTYCEDLALVSLSNLTIQVETGAAKIEGTVTISSGFNIRLEGFSITGLITVSGSTGVAIVGSNGDDEMTASITGISSSAIYFDGAEGSDTIIVHAAHGQVTVDGSGGDDKLVVDFTNNMPPNLQVTFDGGDGFDTLEISSGAFDHVIYQPFGPYSGSYTLDDAQIMFDNIEPVMDTTTANTYTVSGTGGDDAITVTSTSVSDTADCTAGSPCDALKFAAPGMEEAIVANKKTIYVNVASGNDTVTLNFNKPSRGLELLDIQNANSVLVTEAILNGAELSIKKVDSITVNTNAKVVTRKLANGSTSYLTGVSTGDSGDITFEAQTITINSGAQILADVNSGSTFLAGNIVMSVSKKAGYLTPWYDSASSVVKITVNGNALIKGGSVQFKASADHTRKLEDPADGSLSTELFNGMAGVADSISLIAGVAKSSTDAQIDVKVNAEIIADSFSAVAEAKTDAQTKPIGIGAGVVSSQ